MIDGGGGYRGAVWAGVVVAALATAGPGRADEPGGDAVYLKSGGVVRGVVMEYDPGTQARVKLADGEVRTIAADLIARVAMASQAAAPTPPAAPPAPPVPEAARLHVDAPEQVEIVGRPSDIYEWAPICESPCDRPVRLDWEYRVRGAGLKGSAPFELTSSGGQPVTIAVDPASSGTFTLGVVGMIGGGAAAYVGLIVWFVGTIAHQSTSTTNGMTQTSLSADPSTVTVGVGMTLVGAAVALAGTIAAVSNRSTRVRQTTRVDAAAWRPLPVWRTALERPEIALPTPVEAPIVSLSF